jgi:hypothetical protein
LARDEPSGPVVGIAEPQVQTIDFQRFFVHLTFIDGAMVWHDGGFQKARNRLRRRVKSADSDHFKQPSENVTGG